MAGSQTRKGGKKHRKHGRWSRAPSMKHYVAGNRLEVNRKKRAERHRKRVEKKRLKLASRMV